MSNAMSKSKKSTSQISRVLFAFSIDIHLLEVLSDESLSNVSSVICAG